MLGAETVETFDELSEKADSESDVYTLTEPAVDTTSFVNDERGYKPH